MNTNEQPVVKNYHVMISNSINDVPKDIKPIYDPNIHYNHCTWCGTPIETQEERDNWMDEDHNPYHNYCAKEEADCMQLQEEYDQAD